MTYLFRAAAVAALLGASAVSASADGMKKTYSAPPSVHVEQGCGHGPFSGAYWGIQGGWVSADAKQTSLNNGTVLESDDDGWSLGGHIGYNRQCGRLVFGIEADLNWLDLEPRNSIVGQTLSTSYDYFGTLRARAGIAHENILFYLTGGLAFADTTHRIDVPALAFAQSDGDRRVGWTFGGGIELNRGHWSLRGEVLWVDLGSETRTYTLTAPCVACSATIRWDDEFVVARLGLSFKFHREEYQHEPLK